MRTHADIISQALAKLESVTALRSALKERGIEVSDPTVRSWERRTQEGGLIPPEYWPTLQDMGLATVAELAAGAEAKRFPEIAAGRAAAA